MRAEILDVKQGSDAWREWRAGRRMASEAPIIMGCAPSYWETRTWEQLRERHAGFADKQSDRALALFEGGHKGEEIGRAWLEEQLDAEYPARCVQWGAYGASLDGLLQGEVGNAPEWCEIKTCASPNSPVWKAACRHERPPSHVWWQMVHQAGVLQAQGDCALVAVFEDTCVGMRCDRDELLKDWETLRKKWDLFAAGETQHPRIPVGLEKEYLEATAERDAARERVSMARDALVAHLGDSDTLEGARVRVDRVKVFGRVDWKEVALGLQGYAQERFAELEEQMRGKERVDVRVRVTK